ncbi:TonB-dependent receptor [Bacteroides xylanisolvens SD CC 2a]|jgi:tonB-linked outer membrane protein, susC/ragA family|uniref:SusC/RagA family TonB-linked outer membrane protein n=7 Tax=Bacteroides TaxID=816 RepID=A0AAW6I9W5_BACOV|nr:MULTISPECIES: SusC/RagA family TonB-linked outer membrane protein [Bacteroides]EDO09020.1 TonB-linked outer membrane protein, SusC/RagA family [Bacteroides ovatus ATCC 8483]EEZ03000.1 TonB-linked outer membrane protein, SusC/RagA family [Bacteroides sp. 2_1_22]EFF57164.1 TonB-dependent receptor [Bacteroides xylanisolvens SD CC 2a]EFG12138.1 TonB-dependent receptor [Bacteroides xylanisolvens SD CC 1b]EFI15210.1 outer membrane protein [Bacteroides sp. D22]MCS3379052.1 SusC/RagA family TonB-l
MKQNMYKMITTGLLCIAAVALKAQDAPIDSVDHTKSNTLGASSTVYTNDLIKYQSATILTGLQGRLKGLNVSPFRGMQLLRTDANTKSDIVGAIPNVGGGIYGDNSEFLISARGQSPVAIVDGVERDLYSIDPEAIESVTIQKDALSNMFLGMRSSRGALIITTKNPDAKGGFHLSLTGKFGISSALKSGPNPLSAYQYAYLLNEALLNDGKSPLYTYDDFEAYRNGTSPYLHPDVNWKDAIMNNSTTSQAYNLNVTGGGRVAQYFVSLGYYSENGLFKTSDANSYNTNFKYNRYLITSKVNINVTDEFKVSMSLMGRIEEGNQPGGISGTGYSDLLSNVWQTPNNAYPVLNPNGTYGGNASYTQNLYAQTTGSGYISSNTRDVVGTINLKYDFDKLVRGLSVGATGNISSQVRNAIVRTKQAQVFQYSITQQGNEAYDKYGDVSSQTNSYRSVSTYQYMYGKMYVDWERQFGMHGVKASLWGDTRTILNNYDLPMIPSNIGQKVEYNYDNKYFAQAAVTESYYNRYDNGRRWGTFWAVGLGWDISKEKFMEASKIDQLKLRATYGHTGNGIDNAGYFSYLKRYNEDGGFWYSNGTSMSNGGSVSEISPLANTLLTWEKGRKVNVGLDLTLLKNRLTLSADYYNDYYYDILQSRGKSIELLGIAYPAENIGKTRYYGLETQLSWQDHIGKVNYYVSANWSMEQNKRLFMDEQYVPYDYLKMTGQPTGTIYGLVATGFLTAKDIADGYPVMNGFNNIQAGDVKYKDMNGDGEINEFDRTVIGGDKPTCYFGIDLGFEWKGLEVTALIQGAYNRDLYNSDRTLLEGFQVIGQSYGQAYTNLLNRWTPETAETATYPRLTAGGNMYNYGNNWNSSLFVQNGNYIRLKNATVSYKLPENFCRNYLGGLRVKIFVQGQNLLTWSRTRLQDPEVTFTSYPLQRTITTGINLNF